MKAKLFQVEQGKFTTLVIATSNDDADASVDSKAMGERKIREIANVTITGDSIGLSSYAHDRNDLPSDFGSYASLSNEVYDKLASA